MNATHLVTRWPSTVPVVAATILASAICAQTAVRFPTQARARFPSVDVTGTWTGSLDFSGTTRPIVLVLHQTRRGSVLGYMMGGTPERTFVAGSRSRLSLLTTLEFSDPMSTTTWTIEVAPGAGGLTGTANDGSTPQPFTLTRVSGVLHERRFDFAELDGMGELLGIVSLAVVLDDADAFVAGGFVARPDCTVWACSGGLTSFSEVGTALAMGLETDGGCSAGSVVNATFDPVADWYTGTFSFTDCGGTTAGTIVGLRAQRTRSDHVAEILAALGRLVDDFAADVPFVRPHPSLSPTYLHLGWTLTDLLDGFDQELVDYDAIEADFGRMGLIHTVRDPDIFPDPEYDVPFGVALEQKRSGVPSGGGARETYFDTVPSPVVPRLRVWEQEGGRWVVRGDQAPPLTMPFAHAFGTNELEVPTPGGTVYVSLGPYGSHFGPHTGHMEGDAKANLVGFLTQDDGDMVELVGDFDGVRDPGETWGYFGGVAGENVRNKAPDYIAPMDGEITSVSYTNGPTFYFDDVPHWQVELRLPHGIAIRYGHVGRILPPLRDAVLAAVGIDTDTFSGPDGTELLDDTLIPVVAGTALCQPQMLAEQIPGFRDYYVGNGGFLERPWAQMEFQVIADVGTTTADVCVYDLLSSADRATMQTILDTDITASESQRYWDSVAEDKWLWRAEGHLCAAFSTLPEDFSSLYTRLGGWFEADNPTTTVDEKVAFVRIAKDAAAYDPTLYDSPAVDEIVGRSRGALGSFSWLLPDGLHEVFYPRAEVLDHTGNDLLLKWRNIGYTDGMGGELPVYQRATYALDASGLKVKWGNFAATPGGAVQPVLTGADVCNDTDVICYDHVHGGF